VVLYLTSTLYHALPAGRAKRIFLKLDHGAIYLFIAGSYTPFASAPWRVHGVGRCSDWCGLLQLLALR
jgi:channel protein (hemolysin III family)